jgi:hypothetical protein
MHQGTQRELLTMYHLMNNLPVLGTLGVGAMLVGPLARLPIDLGAWLLEMLVQLICGDRVQD